MNKEVETELKAKLKQLPMPEKIKCSALYKHLKEVYTAQNDCDIKNRKIIFDFTEESKPWLKEMAEIAMGNVELTDDLLEGKEDFFTPEELAAKEHLIKGKFDSFYLTVLKKCPSIASTIKAGDEPILKHLTLIEPSVFNDKDDYVLRFHFSANEYFTNESIEVTVVMDDEGTATEIKSDKINWNESKNVTEKVITKKQKNKRTGQTRSTQKTSKQESFFRIFETMKADDEDEEDNENEDEEADASAFEQNEETIGLIKDNVVPYCGPSFFGVIIPELEFDGGDEGDDEDDEDYEDDDEEDDDNKGGKKGNKKKASKKDSKDAKQQECKQN